jgi:hypothetical protein
MASVSGLNNFNNLLYSTKKRAVADKMEHLAGRIGMDLSYKEPARIGEVLTAKASQINGKRGDLLYVPTSVHNRPTYGYDAKYDPTILNSIRNKFVEVSGLLIANKDLPPKIGINKTVRPLKAYNIIS